MKEEYFFKTEDLMIWRPTGTMDLRKIIEFVNFLEDRIKAGKHNFKRFIDLSNIKDISVNHEDLYSVASGRRQFSAEKIESNVKLAFFVTNALSFGMARMYENMLDGAQFDIHIYYTLDEVASFLEVDPLLLAVN
jgi:hypothetical protein